MKVFLSWSGELSHDIACCLRDWLPQILNKVVPYVSSEDIDKGERWASDIAKELEASSFGILMVTPQNVAAPWINFEAGALSKTVDRSNVVPFLFGLKRSDVVGPLLQFQSAVYEEEDVAKLVASINRRLPEEDRRPEQQLKMAFDVWWPHLKQGLDGLPPPRAEPERTDLPEQRKPTALLEEVLDLVRSQQKLLRSPESLLPIPYLLHVLSRARDMPQGTRGSFGPLHSAVRRLQEQARSLRKAEDAAPGLAQLCEDVDRIHDLLHDRAGRSAFGVRRPAAPPSEPGPAKEDHDA